MQTRMAGFGSTRGGLRPRTSRIVTHHPRQLPGPVGRNSPMKCISALSTARSTNAAFHQVLEKLDEGLGETKADLTLLFSSMHHADELGRISAALLEQGRTRHVLGCTGESIIGEDREVEGSPALAAWSIAMPGVSLAPLRLGEPGEGRGLESTLAP